MNSILKLVLWLCFPVCLFAQNSKVYDHLSMKSKILNMDRKYAIYLPPGYETSQRSYPVLYLLHGMGDDQTGWVQFGEVQHITDKAIMDGMATPMIIVMPDANTGKVGYFNDVKGIWNYEDFFFQEFIPFIEKEYRIKAEKRYRAIAGLSMGGGGSFLYALHQPDMFSSACPLSAYTGPILMDDMAEQLKWQGYESADEQAVESWFQRHSATELLKNMPVDEIKKVRWYIDCGDDDFLFEGNSLAHITMKKREILHEFRIRDGAHNWTYWRASLPTVLQFISEAFHQY